MGTSSLISGPFTGMRPDKNVRPLVTETSRSFSHNYVLANDQKPLTIYVKKSTSDFISSHARLAVLISMLFYPEARAAFETTECGPVGPCKRRSRLHNRNPAQNREQIAKTSSGEVSLLNRSRFHTVCLSYAQEPRPSIFRGLGYKMILAKSQARCDPSGMEIFGYVR
jgi:hypothetical protein